MSVDEHGKSYNIKKLIEYVGEEEETIKEMVAIFLKTAPELLVQMVDACEKGDMNAASRTAHKLKPSLDVFGLDDLGAPIRKIEQSFKNDESPEMIRPVILLVEQRLALVLEQMHADYSI